MSKFSGFGIPVDESSRLYLMHPYTGQPLRDSETKEQAWIDLFSVYSKIGRAHDRAMLDKNIRRGNRRLTAEEFEADELEKLSKLTKAWFLVLPNGSAIDVECTQDNARELYAWPDAVWLVEQIRAFIADLGNFRQGASLNS